MPTDDDSIREHIAFTLDVAVRSGYGSKDEIHADLVEQVCDEFRERDTDTIAAEVARFEAALDRQWEAQLEAEAGWEPATVNDRLDAAFDELSRRGIVALQEAGYTMSDGWEDVHDAAREIDGAWGACSSTDRTSNGQWMAAGSCLLSVPSSLAPSTSPRACDSPAKSASSSPPMTSQRNGTAPSSNESRSRRSPGKDAGAIDRCIDRDVAVPGPSNVICVDTS